MKKSASILGVLLLICFLFSFDSKKNETGARVVIETSLGNMVVKLYDETPLHKANFVKLAESNFYDGLLFHRVIKDFMIQGGDPESRGAALDKMLGQGGPGYTIPAEFVSMYIHKKGALSAARLGDQMNPKRESSGSQFYIVQGKVYSEAELDVVEKNRIDRYVMGEIRKYISIPENEPIKKEIMRLQASNKIDSLQMKIESIKKIIAPQIKDVDKLKYTAEQRKIYTTIGGTPHLDFEYTVFGEVIENVSVVDSIAAVKTNNSRPLENMMIKKMRILK